MPPTIQNGSNSTDKRPQRPAERKSELINKVKYCNTLPDIPFDLKFITYPFENDRFIQYNPTSLERNYRYEVLTEHDLGVTIDLINRDLYQTDPYSQLDPADEKLLEEDVHTPQDSMRSKYHAKSVSWLRKSEYISTEQTRFQPQTMEKVEAKVGFNVKKSFVEETLYMDRETQIKAIEKTFEESKSTLTNHYSKPNVTAVEVLPLFPDFANWKFPCAQVIFDSDPAESGKNIPAQIEEMSQAMIRGVMDESGEQFVAYFLPTEDTLHKRRRDIANEVVYEDDEEYEYKMAREYNWNVKSKASKGYEENYFLVVRPDGVYYDELETRVRLNKRRQKVGTPATSTKLIVKHIPLNASEHRMQRYRERQLEAPCEEEEEVEESEPEEEDEPAEVESQEKDSETQDNEAKDDNAGSDRSRSHSRSRSRSKSDRSRSGSRSPSQARVKSRSRSRAIRSASRATNKSRATSRSASSRSGSGSRSSRDRRSHSRSVMSRATNKSSRSRAKSGSRTGSSSRSPSRSKSRSVAPRSGRSASRATNKSRSSRSRSRSQSGSRSPSRSRSGRSASRGTHKSRASSRQSRASSRSRSGSRSQSGGSRRTSRSRSGSRSGSGSRSPSRSRSRSKSGSGSRSGSASPARSQSRSGSESGSASD